MSVVTLMSFAVTVILLSMPHCHVYDFDSTTSTIDSIL